MGAARESGTSNSSCKGSILSINLVGLLGFCAADSPSIVGALSRLTGALVSSDWEPSARTLCSASSPKMEAVPRDDVFGDSNDIGSPTCHLLERTTAPPRPRSGSSLDYHFVRLHKECSLFSSAAWQTSILALTQRSRPTFDASSRPLAESPNRRPYSGRSSPVQRKMCPAARSPQCQTAGIQGAEAKGAIWTKRLDHKKVEPSFPPAVNKPVKVRFVKCSQCEGQFDILKNHDKACYWHTGV